MLSRSSHREIFRWPEAIEPDDEIDHGISVNKCHNIWIAGGGTSPPVTDRLNFLVNYSLILGLKRKTR